MVRGPLVLRAVLIIFLMLLMPWSVATDFEPIETISVQSDDKEPVDNSDNIFLNSNKAQIWPPSSDWWMRGEEEVEVFVITRDLFSLDIWQKSFGYEVKQSQPLNGELLVETTPSSGILEHRKLILPANVVPKILGINGVMSIFENPGSPEPFSIDSAEPVSVRTGELHGATDSWAMGVNGTGVKVAVVDSGIDFAHPDLNGTQARVDDPNNPYDGWPIMWDPRSVDIWLKDGDSYPLNRGSYYSDTTNLDNDSNNNSILDLTGFNVSGLLPSLSGIYHYGLHPDSQLIVRTGGEVNILVVDDFTAGVYDTVYVDFDRDGNFSEEKPMRRGSETSGIDTDSDGLWDQSGGLLYWISDGVNGVPYGATYAARAGFQNRIAGSGNGHYTVDS